MEPNDLQHYDRIVQGFVETLIDASGTSPVAIRGSVELVEQWRTVYQKSGGKPPSEFIRKLERPDRNILVRRLEQIESDDKEFARYKCLVDLMEKAERDPALRRDVAVYMEDLTAEQG